MLLEVLLLAEPHLLFPGTGGALRRMSECPRDIEAYWKLSDSIVKQIEISYSPVRVCCFFTRVMFIYVVMYVCMYIFKLYRVVTILYY